MYPSLFNKDRSAEPEMQCRWRSLDGELRSVLGERVLACRFPVLSLRPSQEPRRSQKPAGTVPAQISSDAVSGRAADWDGPPDHPDRPTPYGTNAVAPENQPATHGVEFGLSQFTLDGLAHDLLHGGVLLHIWAEALLPLPLLLH